MGEFTNVCVETSHVGGYHLYLIVGVDVVSGTCAAGSLDVGRARHCSWPGSGTVVSDPVPNSMAESARLIGCSGEDEEGKEYLGVLNYHERE